MNKTTPALSVQIGGDHYKNCAIQPVQYIEANNLKFLEGCVVKRVTRHDKPTGKGRQDIEKALHELQLILELRYPMPANDNILSDHSPADAHAAPIPFVGGGSPSKHAVKGCCRVDNTRPTCDSNCPRHGNGNG